MTPSAKAIPDEDWKRYGDTVHDLYHTQRLRLHGKEGERSVQQVMRDEHGFYAR
jgi:hypothetical protein